MARSKPTRKPQETGATARSGVHPQWLWVTLVAGLAFGGAFGYFAGQAVGRDGSPTLDSYGRAPSHAHYNHNHP
jgi:hypothetical protein